MEDAKSIGHRLLMHKGDEQHMIFDLKEDKVDVHDKQVPEEEDNRIRLIESWFVSTVYVPFQNHVFIGLLLCPSI